MYKAEILADSAFGFNRLTTMKVTYPRIVHAEMCRHRMLSRNTASSRAIPFEKMVKDVQENPFIPVAWQKAHKGMQGSEYWQDDEYGPLINRTYKVNIKVNSKYNWLDARDACIAMASTMHKNGVTKQLCNRLLEPFVWVTEIISGTEWENFFNLRCPAYECRGRLFKSKRDLKVWAEDLMYNSYSELDWLKINKSQADIHIQAIAELMWDAMNESTPKQLQAGEFHVPFGDNFDERKLITMLLSGRYDSEDGITPDINILKIKIAVARCARISYETLGDNPKVDYDADIRLHDRLKEMKHWSPFEHIARAAHGQYCNFTGFQSYRRLLE
jgi:hypothetical protein